MQRRFGVLLTFQRSYIMMTGITFLNSKPNLLRAKVMQSGPYFYVNRPLILRNWELNFEFNADIFSHIPIWVKFPSLLVGYWFEKALSKVSNAIGVPLYINGFIATAEKISYARVLIEVDISKDLLNDVVVEIPYGPWTQNIEYEWRPKFYNHWLTIGHKEYECWYKHSPEESNEERK